MALALAMVLQATPTPAVAVTGYDSAFLFESDWLIVKPGESGQAAVTFLNVGSVSWQKGGASQVNLATCCPLNSPPTHAAWAVTWLSSTAYATHREDLVAPGGRGTYIWNFKAPDTAAVGIYDFPGDLVLASTGEAIHREGYFHRNDLRTAAPTVAADLLTLTPEFASQQIGQNITFSALVEGAKDTAGTRAKVANAEVTFVVDAGANDTGNADFSRTATTDANGIALLTYTRSNPGTDRVSAFVTAKPTVRDESNVSWTVAANPIVVTPDDAANVANGQCRTYTVEAKNADTGDPLKSTILQANFQENFDTSTTNNSGGDDTVAGVVVSGTSSADVTTDSSGRASFSVCGTDYTGTPVVFDNRSGGTIDVLETGDLRDTGGKVTFGPQTFTITITPTDAAESDTPSQRAFTVEVKDQNGVAAAGADLSIAFNENLDIGAANDTTAVISWFDSTDPFSTSAQRTCTAVPSSTGATGVNAANKHDITLSSAGKLTFAICSNSNTTATPVVWVDQLNNNARDSAESSALGGQTKYVTAAVGGGRLRAASGNIDEFNGTTTAGTIGGLGGDNGEEVFTYTALNRNGGNFTGGSQTVQFTVANNGTKTFCVQDVSGAESPAVGTDATDCGSLGTAIAAGGSVTFTTTTSQASSTDPQIATITLDSEKVTKATITAQVVGISASSKTATKEWLAPGPAEPVAGTTTPFIVTGTVISNDTGASTSDGGSYTLKTTANEIVTITYDTDDVLIVAGSAVSEASFEDRIGSGDTMKFTNDTTTNDRDTHEITTDVP